MKNLCRFALLVSLPLAACGDDPVFPFSDVAFDVTSDTGVSPTDAGDTALDAATDAATDAGADTVTDTDPRDASDDTSGEDAAVDADGDADPTCIGAEGGTFAFEGGTLTIEAGALDDCVDFTVTQVDVAPEGYLLDSPVFEFQPEGTRFASPQDVCLDVSSPRPNAAVYWSDEGDNTTFSALATRRRGESQFCGKTDHLSRAFVGLRDDCVDVVCEPGEDTCDGTTAVLAGLPVCVDGGCVDVTERVDCAALGQACEAGACVDTCGNGSLQPGESCDGVEFGDATCQSRGFFGGALACTDLCRIDESGCFEDPCADVLCGPAPVDTCDGRDVVSYTAGGCSEGDCLYPESRISCAATGDVCIDAACFAGPSIGALVITEMLVDATGEDAGKEWFEVRNVADFAIAIPGLVVSDDGGNTFTVNVPAIIEPGADFVFGATAGAGGGADFVWSGLGTFTLANTEDEIVLTFDDNVIDRVAYTAEWPLKGGATLSLSAGQADATANDSAANWCSGLTLYDADNLGTPGAPNPVCAVCGDGEIQAPETCDDTNTDDGDGCSALCQIEPDCTSDSDCDAPPADACAGTVFQAYADEGVCDDSGSCVYEPAVEDCAPSAQICTVDGCAIPVDTVLPGDVIVTEFFADPTGADADLEWFEVFNTTGRTINLRGLVVSDDGGSTFSVGSDLMLGGGAYAVFAEALTSTPGGPAPVFFAWNTVSSWGLTNTNDEIVLTLGGVEMDRVAYDSALWPIAEGASANLSITAFDASANDAPSNWCVSENPMAGDTYYGTPGTVNANCGTGTACTSAAQCTNPPEASCDGNTAQTYNVGVCLASGFCDYAEDRVACGDRACADGACIDSDFRPGDLVITEFLKNPAGSDTDMEWFEVYNASGHALQLNGLVVTDLGSNAFTVDTPFEMAAGTYAVFGESVSAVPGQVRFAWDPAPGSFTLSNDDDEIILTMEGVELDRVAFVDSGWPDSAGRSASLHGGILSATGNDSGVAWCDGSGTYGVGTNEGTPGVANPVCESP